MKKILLLSFVAALLSACSSVSFTEDVTINSKPCGADVFLNGELLGKTPVAIELDTKGVYEIKLVKAGYKDKIMNLASVRDDQFIKFGPLVDLGYYKTFEVDLEGVGMTPDFLPTSKGTNAFGDMAAYVVKVDEMRKSGKIGEDEHTYLLGQLTNFYADDVKTKNDKGFNEMTVKIAKADGMLESGEITKEEHSKMVKKITDSYKK